MQSLGKSFSRNLKVDLEVSVVDNFFSIPFRESFLQNLNTTVGLNLLPAGASHGKVNMLIILTSTNDIRDAVTIEGTESDFHVLVKKVFLDMLTNDGVLGFNVHLYLRFILIIL